MRFQIVKTIQLDMTLNRNVLDLKYFHNIFTINMKREGVMDFEGLWIQIKNNLLPERHVHSPLFYCDVDVNLKL